jgi:DNA-binding Lrp family transcriptional regulator
MVVKAIYEGKLNVKRDNAGRLYSPLSSLKRELRTFVMLNGKPISSIDLKSSQPYLFQLLLNAEFWKTTRQIPITLYTLNPSLYKELQASGIIKRIIMILNSSEKQQYQGFHTEGFRKIDWQDDFYEYLGKLTNRTTTDKDVTKYYSSRGRIKQSMMLLLYGDYSKMSPPYYTAFKKLFPLETEVMDLIKTAGRRAFPKILQGIEAKIVLEMVTKEIASDYPDIPLLTIHDCVYTNTEYLSIVTTYLNKTLTNLVGTAPGLKEEIISREDVFEGLENTVKEDWGELYGAVTAIRQEPSWLQHFEVNLNEVPLLYTFPEVDGKRKLSTRYLDPNLDLDDLIFR